MKKLPALLLTVLVIMFALAFTNQQTIPAEITGKWKLKAENNRLIGTLEITGDGRYTYAVLPNYMESGVATVFANKDPKQIDLNSSAKTTTKGIYKISGNTLTLMLGNSNDGRPLTFSNNSANTILWTGTKQ